MIVSLFFLAEDQMISFGPFGRRNELSLDGRVRIEQIVPLQRIDALIVFLM